MSTTGDNPTTISDSGHGCQIEGLLGRHVFVLEATDVQREHKNIRDFLSRVKLPNKFKVDININKERQPVLPVNAISESTWFPKTGMKQLSVIMDNNEIDSDILSLLTILQAHDAFLHGEFPVLLGQQNYSVVWSH